MTLYISNRDGNGKTDEMGHYKFPSNAFAGSVVMPGLAVTQNSPLGMSVLVASGDFRIDTGTGYAYTGWNNTSQTLTINVADASNPRIDTVVVYVDKSAATSASPPNNPGIAKFKVVVGTPGGIPTAPDGSAIQSSVGAANPYIILADIRVNAGVTQIINSNITDRRTRVTIANDFVTETSLIDGAVATNKLANSAVTTPKLANDAVSAAKIISGAAIKPSEIAMFNATKTSEQTAVTNNAVTLITWNADDEYKGTSYFSGSTFTAPVAGWLWTTCCLTIRNGTAADDTMTWGFCVNGSFTNVRTTDNWRFFSSGAGVEYPTTLSGGIPLAAGDQVTVRYEGTSYGVIIMGSAGVNAAWSGLFIPNY